MWLTVLQAVVCEAPCLFVLPGEVEQDFEISFFCQTRFTKRFVLIKCDLAKYPCLPCEWYRATKKRKHPQGHDDKTRVETRNNHIVNVVYPF